ncbi:ABC transporter, permease protein [Oceaniovalibus guishaninsula JLT2003]|uniref:ABC transporter, permease protein n=1 Tax=Oceaniovalibus guishaninsula JLT2003 TaxID=1231392 RepID=K2HAT4_9RHOB|nr:ABC transporter permease subunit [Oceaniovalibus guishaninsula]EKE43787.1 ABC transporter, permease protein [Oceaniovalibus guishaninsula JLT2003]
MNRLLMLAPVLTVAALLGPVVAGLVGVLRPALFPVTDGPASLAALHGLLEWPGLGPAVRLSVVTGLAATLLSLAIVIGLVAGWSGTRAFRAASRVLSPLLSMPHAAAAFGLAFLIAPSGWVVRAVAPLAGLDRPPDLPIPGDAGGLALIAGLVAKEVPFLLLMTLAALPQANAEGARTLSATLGYGRMTGWIKTVLPQVYAQIRLPVYVVLAYSMSVVDVAMILGPNTPPPLAVQIVRWMADPALGQRNLAAAGSLLQLALVVGAIGAWRLVELAVAAWGRGWASGGRRGQRDGALRFLALGVAALPALAAGGGLAVLALWSVAGYWAFPMLLPADFTATSWMRHAGGLAGAAGNTALIALAATGVALLLTLGCLEAEHRRRRPITAAGLRLLYLPLLVPQIAFLPGLQVLLLHAGADRGAVPVIAAHLVFVLPYVLLSLGDPWRAWDDRFATVAASLGARPRSVLLRVRLPMLLRPVLTAAAVGMAVSVGQYLPTLLIGGGRVATLTTEAVALASGADRRAIGVFALAQTAAALVPFTLAIALPAWFWRNRRGLHA